MQCMQIFLTPPKKELSERQQKRKLLAKLLIQAEDKLLLEPPGDPEVKQ